jgi:hypothetical protein
MKMMWFRLCKLPGVGVGVGVGPPPTPTPWHPERIPATSRPRSKAQHLRGIFFTRFIANLPEIREIFLQRVEPRVSKAAALYFSL